MIPLEKWKILTPLQKLTKNVGNFGQNNWCHRLWKVAQSAINCPIWSHWLYAENANEPLLLFGTFNECIEEKVNTFFFELFSEDLVNKTYNFSLVFDAMFHYRFYWTFHPEFLFMSLSVNYWEWFTKRGRRWWWCQWTLRQVCLEFFSQNTFLK